MLCLEHSVPLAGSSDCPSAATAAAQPRLPPEQRDKAPATAADWQRVTPGSSLSFVQARAQFGAAAFPGKGGSWRSAGPRSQARSPLPARAIPGSGHSRSRPRPPEDAALARTSLDGDRSFKTESETPEGLWRLRFRL